MADIQAKSCDCADGQCREYCSPITDCVNRIARQGEVITKWCEVQVAYTWHLNGKCLRCEKMKVGPKNVDSLIAILAQIREALGVGPKPMWSELPGEAREIRAGYDRYQKIRRLTPVEFARLWKAALHNRNNFDQLVDKIGLPN